jgi:hypothetical protein
MTKKALYLCCIAHPWINVAKRLEDNGVLPVYFVHWASDSAVIEKEFNKNCYLQTLEDAWKGLGFPKHLNPKALDEGYFKEIAWYELNALKMMDRLDPLGNEFSFQERRYFFQDLVGYWLSCIDEYGIDVVISPSIPHRVFDYALYVACKIKGLKFLMFQMVPFGSTSILIDNIDNMDIDLDVGVGQLAGVNLPDNVKEKIERVKRDYKSAMPEYMVSHAKNQKISFKRLKSELLAPVAKVFLSYFGYKKSPNTYWVEKGKVPSVSRYSWLSHYVMSVRRSIKVHSMRKQYESLTTDNVPDKFVLFALHYQPEETSCPTGGSYADQICLLKLLLEILPTDIKIVVKEHKSQFYTHQESASGRDSSFYQRLACLSDRVTFASVDAVPFELIDRAMATVTISGTIGWESAVRGTPTLVFGRAWYESMPRVHKLKSKNDLLNVIPLLKLEKNLDMDEEIAQFHLLLESKVIVAKHYKAFLKNNDVSMTESEEALSRAIVSAVHGSKEAIA